MMIKIKTLLMSMMSLPLLSSCVEGDSFQVYDTIWRDPWYQNMNPKHVKFWYYGSSGDSDYFMLVRKKIKLSKNHVEKGFPPFLCDDERFKFEGWKEDKRRRLLWTLVQFEGETKLILKLPKNPNETEDLIDALTKEITSPGDLL